MSLLLHINLIELFVPLLSFSNKTACLPTQGAPQPSSLPACSTPGSIECATNWAAGLILRWPALLHKGLVAWELGMVGMWSSAIFAAAERSEVLYLLYWYKRTNTGWSACGLALFLLLLSALRHSIYLPYWYKCTNTETKGGV